MELELELESSTTLSNKNNKNLQSATNYDVAAASREDMKAAIAKAVELRAIHAALLQGTSPTNLRFLSSPPPLSSTSHPNNLPNFTSAPHDYPVFTPSYEDEETLPGYRQIQPESRALSENWEDYGLGGVREGDEISQSNYVTKDPSSRKGFLPPGLATSGPHNNCPADHDTRSVTSSCTHHHHHISRLQTSPNLAEALRSRRRNSLGDLNSVSSSCSRCKVSINNGAHCNKHSSNIVVPLTDSHLALHSQPSKSRGMILPWLFPRFRKKQKGDKNCPFRGHETEEVSQILRDQFGVVSIETLKKELIETSQKRDSALAEVAEMRSSFGDLKLKLENVEKYCEELKRALRQNVSPNGASRQTRSEKLGSLSIKGKLSDGNGERTMPVTEEVMVEGFLQIVSEARLSVKHFCKLLVGQVEEADELLIENLNSLLLPYKLSINSKYTKAVLYHLEAIINQALYQDFENCVFKKNGCTKVLDPQQGRQAQFSSFVALRNLSWNEVLKKGTKYYSEDFSKFCDQKMSCIVTTLNWIRPWPEQLLQSFFVTAKCIWLLHLLAFSFSPPLTILRVEENRAFDHHYMEDVFIDRQRSQGPSRVKIMVMPGFYVQDKILRCKVLCRYKFST